MSPYADYRRGLFCALAANGIWGFAPLYFRAVHAATPVELLCHRVLWSAVLLSVVLAVTGNLLPTLRLLRNRRTLARLVLSSALICANWLFFISAISVGRTLEASFGGFVTPLVSIALGVAILDERLTRLQIACVALAIAGVTIQLLTLGRLPWMGLGLALTLALYALVRKRSAIPPVAGLFIETLMAAPVALAAMLWMEANGTLAFSSAAPALDVLLICAGVVTSIPLILFVTATQRIPLSMVGFLQYVAPSLQFLVAIALFGEPLGAAKLVSFCFAWLGLTLLVVGPRLMRRRTARSAPTFSHPASLPPSTLPASIRS